MSVRLKSNVATRLIRRGTVLCISIYAAISGGAAYAQDIAPLYTPKTPVPQGSYRSWSLFLVNNPQWVVAESNQKIKNLYDQFEAFGKAIGQNHVAVWFWTQNIWEDEYYYKSVDVIRSAAFCAKLPISAPPSDGPYLFVTIDYPGAGLINDSSTFLPNQPTAYYVVSLNNKSADEVMQILTRVADKVTAERIQDLNVESEAYWNTWQRIFESLRSFFNSFNVTVNLKTPLGELEIR